MPGPAALQPNTFYHLYNQGNNHEDLFTEEANYRYFLDLYARHVPTTADTWAYCLLRNHFHFVVRVRGEDDRKDLSGLPGPDRSGISASHIAPSRAFANLFDAYARAYNAAVGRSGALFRRPFQRIPISDDDYLRQLIVYVHRNPQTHGLIGDFRRWPHSSYRTLIGRRNTRLQRDGVIDLFGGLNSFVEAHSFLDLSGLQDLTGLEL